MRVVGLSVVVSLLFVACGGGGDGTPVAEGVQGTVTGGVISLPVSIDGTTAQPFIVDTGSPLTRLDPNRFASVGISPGFGQVSTLDVGDVHLTDVDIVAASVCGVMMACSGREPAGLLGGDVLMMFEVTLDYRSAMVAFGPVMPPADVAAPVTVSFALQGGGRLGMDNSSQTVTLPATRIAVDVSIEGTTVPMILDTGSSTVVLQPELYDSIVADGRDQFTIDVSTVTGQRSVSATRLTTVALGSATQMMVTAMRAPLDLSALEREVGHQLQGLLGGAYLIHYLTTIDYPASQITLRAY